MSTIDTDKLSGTYKELWRVYQNQEQEEIKDLDYDALEERILKYESIEFEARAKRQKVMAEKRVRDQHRDKELRAKLITDPHYSPKDSPSRLLKEQKPYKIKGERLSAQDKLKNNLGELGVDLGDLLKDLEAKKTLNTKKNMENQ